MVIDNNFVICTTQSDVQDKKIKIGTVCWINYHHMLNLLLKKLLVTTVLESTSITEDSIFWDVTLGKVINSYRRFQGITFGSSWTA
jgi:hypothetical protein